MFRTTVSKEIADALTDYDTSLLFTFDENERYSLIKYGDVVEGNVGDVRGWVIDKKDNKIVCKSFPYTPVYTFTGNPSMLDRDEYQISLEGTVIRIWTGYDSEGNTKLFLSTHSRLQCDRSRWNSNKTFMQMFEEAMDVLKFDKQRFMDGNIHILMLSHQQNQLTNLYNITFPTVYHLESLHPDTFENVECDFNLPKVSSLTKEQAFHFMITGGHGVVSTGIHNKVKIVSPHYESALNIVGGKHLYHRYVELMRTNEQDLLQHVVPLCRIEEVKAFKKRYDDMIYEATPHLTQLYLHWKKTGERVDVRYHKFFITIREITKPNVMKVIKSALYSYDPIEVKKICKRIMNEVRDKQ